MGWVDAVYGKPEKPLTATDTPDAPLPVRLADSDAPLGEPPEMFRAEPAVKEAELVIQGRSISRPITDGRVIR